MAQVFLQLGSSISNSDVMCIVSYVQFWAYPYTFADKLCMFIST